MSEANMKYSRTYGTTKTFAFPKKPATSQIQKCEHGVYWPKHQKFPHGCQSCNPTLLAFDPDPAKTIAVFRLKNGLKLQDQLPFPKEYGTVFEMKLGRYIYQRFRHGGFADVSV
jgi:hypothetical protein